MSEKHVRLVLDIIFPEGNLMSDVVPPVQNGDAALWLNQLKHNFPGLIATLSPFKEPPAPKSPSRPRRPVPKKSHPASPKKPLKAALPASPTTSPDGFAQLTVRQKDIVNLLFKGCSYREIGKTLGISLPTVRAHLHSAYKRLQVKSRAQAVAKIFRESPPGSFDVS